MYYTDNPVRDWDRYCEEQDRKYKKHKERLPICVECDKPIETDYCYEINDEYLCENCMDNHRHLVDDLI